MKNLAVLLLLVSSLILSISSCNTDEAKPVLQNLITDEIATVTDIAVFSDDSYLAVTHGGTLSLTYRFTASHSIEWDIAENPTFADYHIVNNSVYLLTSASGVTGFELIQLDQSGEEIMRFDVLANTQVYHWNRMKVFSDHISFISSDGSRTDNNAFFQTSYSMEGEQLSFTSLPLPGSPFDNYIISSMIGDDGAIVVSLESSSFGSSLLKFENNELIWSCQLNEGDTRIEDIIQDEQGNYTYVGFEFINNRSRGFIGKVDANGNQLWEKYHVSSGDESRYKSLMPDQQGGYLVLGFNNDDYPDEIDKNLWLLKMDENGEIEWQRTYGNASTSFNPQAIAQRSDGSMLVGGALLDQTSYRGFIMAFDQSGNPMNQ